jgi:1-phosphatidylinositol-3-phosphate 5-kinase
LDERFILKAISSVELESFLQFAPQYFDYLSKVYFHQVPTALTKIFGVYTIHYKRKGNKSIKQDIIVMENLFYKRKITKVNFFLVNATTAFHSLITHHSSLFIFTPLRHQ